VKLLKTDADDIINVKIELSIRFNLLKLNILDIFILLKVVY